MAQTVSVCSWAWVCGGCDGGCDGGCGDGGCGDGGSKQMRVAPLRTLKHVDPNSSFVSSRCLNKTNELRQALFSHKPHKAVHLQVV